MTAAAAIPTAIFAGEMIVGPFGAMAIIAIGGVLGWRLVPGFFRILFRAAIAGGLAGILVLGPGYRLAMRVVAVLDEATTPEFTIEGTLFLIVGIGAVFGGITTAWVTIITRTFDVRRWVAVSALTSIAAGILFVDSEVFSELTDLGLGAFVNVPMFLGVTVAWASLADRWARPVSEPVSADADLVAVP